MRTVWQTFKQSLAPLGQAWTNMGRPLRARPLHIQLYLAFMAVVVPTYAVEYGIVNFLYVCDIALLVTLVAFLANDEKVESELISAALCGMLLPQSVWVYDFFKCVFGSCHQDNLTAYMFNSKLSLYLRSLSFFHVWLIFFLIYSAGRVGYSSRGWVTWSKIAAAVLMICYFVSPPPGAPPELPRNINYVYGWNDNEIQLDYPQWIWVTGLILTGPIILYLPSHLICLTAIRVWRILRAKVK
jgi:hypothetical protein